MSPTPRFAYLVGALALGLLALPAGVVAGAAAALLVALGYDLGRARRLPRLRRSLPAVLPRGVPTPLRITCADLDHDRMRLRQPAGPDLRVEPAEGPAPFDATLVAVRRGRHPVAEVAARRDGPLGLGCWSFRGEGRSEVLVYPDVPAARRLALAVRHGRFRESGRHTRGPLGLGTDFESIRDYVPDDDFRQINWRATARSGRPMSNQYRVEQDRDVWCLVDTGRLMSAPLGNLTRLDAAVDALTAVSLVADELGDRCGAIAFDAEIRRRVAPRRRGSDAVVRSVFDVEPRPLDSDYDLAFRNVGGAKRALVVVLTDLLDEAAARSLLGAVPVLSRRHAVIVASAEDPDLARAVTAAPATIDDVYVTAVTLDVLEGRRRVASVLRRAGAEVVEAPAARLGEACVGAYLRLKDRARL